MKALKHYFKIPETLAGMIIAVAFQLIFFTIWMTAYNGVNERLENLKVAIVNQDKGTGPSIATKLKENLPFTVTEQDSLEIMKNQMNMRNWDMIIMIPESFTQQLQQNGMTNIEFYINQSSTTFVKNMMETTAKQVTTEINHQVFHQTDNNLNDQVVVGKIIKTNEVAGFTATMIPLMVILASFVGSMLMSLQLNIATRKLQTLATNGELLFSRLIINLISAGLSATITLIFFRIFEVELTQSLFITWLFQALVLFTFLGVTQMSLILFGKIGVYFNILLLATQLVVSGAIVPRALLSNMYQSVSTYLPATYATDGYFNLIFGGGNLLHDMKGIAAILFVALVITAGKLASSRKVIKVKKPATRVAKV